MGLGGCGGVGVGGVISCIPNQGVIVYESVILVSESVILVSESRFVGFRIGES